MNKIIMGIDPGQYKSGVASFDGVNVTDYVIIHNEALQVLLADLRACGHHRKYHIVMEEFKNYGMGIGKPTIDSIFWSGRFFQAWQPNEIALIPRKTIATNICGVARAGNSNIMHALIDRFTEEYADRLGDGATPVKGTKKNPGPLYGMADHMWSALAVAVTYWDQQQEG